MKHIPLTLTQRQTKRYTKNGTLEEKLQEVKSFNEYQKKVVDNIANITDKAAAKFMHKNRFGNIKYINVLEDAKHFLSNQQIAKKAA